MQGVLHSVARTALVWARAKPLNGGQSGEPRRGEACMSVCELRHVNRRQGA